MINNGSADTLGRGNRLLAALSPDAYRQVVPHLEPLALTFRLSMYEPDEPIPYVYFPSSGVTSILALGQDGGSVEVATVGNEGMVGIPLVLGASQTAGQAFVQIPGAGTRIAAAPFRELLGRNGPFRDLLQRYLQALFDLLAQNVACNRLHAVEERFARWMLMCSDRMAEPSFPLTQEFIAQMLGVRRASVSVVARRFQEDGLLRYSRGQMTILDVQGLRASACECYEIINAVFDRLLGPAITPYYPADGDSRDPT